MDKLQNTVPGFHRGSLPSKSGALPPLVPKSRGPSRAASPSRKDQQNARTAAQRGLEEVVGLMQAQKFLPAINKLEQATAIAALNRVPLPGGVRRLRADAFRGAAQHPAAIAEYTALLQQAPFDLQLYYARGLCYLGGGDYAPALAEFEKVEKLADPPSSSGAYRTEQSTAFDADSVWPVPATAIDIDFGCDAVLVRKAEALYRLKRYEAAEQVSGQNGCFSRPWSIGAEDELCVPRRR